MIINPMVIYIIIVIIFITYKLHFGILLYYKTSLLPHTPIIEMPIIKPAINDTMVDVIIAAYEHARRLELVEAMMVELVDVILATDQDEMRVEIEAMLQDLFDYINQLLLFLYHMYWTYYLPYYFPSPKRMTPPPPLAIQSSHPFWDYLLDLLLHIFKIK